MLTNDITKICKEHSEMRKLIRHIQDALDTAETGEALVEVARNAHKAELELASFSTGAK